MGSDSRHRHNQVRVQLITQAYKLVSKFPAGDFAVMLFHYDGAVEQWGDLEWSRRAVHVAAPGQTKWWFAKRFLHPDVVAEYDYVSVWDEDVEVDAFDPARYLAAVRREGLEVSQPALDRRSEIHHAITTRARGPGPPGGVHGRVRDARCGDGGGGGPPCATRAQRGRWCRTTSSTAGGSSARLPALLLHATAPPTSGSSTASTCSTPPPRRAHARRQVGGVGRGEVAVFQGDADFQQAVGGGCRGGRVMD